MNRAEIIDAINSRTAEQAFRWMEKSLNGWQAVLVSHPSPKLVRLQLYDPAEEGSRCFHGPDLVVAFQRAMAYTKKNPRKQG